MKNKTATLWADELAELLKAKNPNGSYVLRKGHRVLIIMVELYLRRL